MSRYSDLLDQVVLRVQALGLVHNATPLTVVKRKLPAAEEVLDTLPLACVCPSEVPLRVRPFAFRVRRYVYSCDVVVIAAGNHMLVQGLDEVTGWQELVVDAFAPAMSLPTFPNLFDTDVTPDRVIDRTKLAQQYDYTAVGLAFHVRVAV